MLEIWPAGHNSPIHNHGNAYGIVRVLHGDITGAHSGRPWRHSDLVPHISRC